MSVHTVEEAKKIPEPEQNQLMVSQAGEEKVANPSSMGESSKDISSEPSRKTKPIEKPQSKRKSELQSSSLRKASSENECAILIISLSPFDS